MIRPPMTAAIVALCALLSGCPESVHPVSDPAAAAPDPLLFGVWHGSFDGDEIYLHVAPGERGLTKAVMVEHKKDGKLRTEHYVAFPSTVGTLAMLNVRRMDEVDQDRGYTLFRYQADKRKLTLWMLAYGAARDDINAGKLPGKAGDGPFGETRITASSAQLAAYLLEGDPARLFDKPLPFRRLAAR